MIKKYASLEEFLKDYEEFPQAFNMLVDIQSVQEFSDLYRPVINLVQISTDPEDREIYHNKTAKDPAGRSYPPSNPRFSLTKHGLNKIKNAAIVKKMDAWSEINYESKTVTGMAVIVFRNPTGEWTTVTDSQTKSMLKTAQDGTVTNDLEAAQKVITGATNRCIRKAFAIKDHYSKAQLENPFVLLNVVMNDRIPEVRQAQILAAVAPNALLYGRKQMAQLSAAKEEHVDPETGEILQGGEPT